MQGVDEGVRGEERLCNVDVNVAYVGEWCQEGCLKRRMIEGIAGGRQELAEEMQARS